MGQNNSRNGNGGSPKKAGGGDGPASGGFNSKSATRITLVNVPEKDIRRLDLSERGLVEIPDDLWAFTRLESLNLSSNLITKVPDGAVALTTLIELLCENCRLTSFPEPFLTYSSMEILTLSRNRLGAIPSDISRLGGSLHTLRLDSCFLTDIPDEICELVLLETLSLSMNSFQRIPEGITRLVELTSLNLSHSQISDIDVLAAGGGLSKLTELLCARCSLVSLPPDMSCWTRTMIKLDLRGNYLGSVPDSIGDLAELVELVLAENPFLREVSPRLWDLAKLSKLQIHHCALPRLPDNDQDASMPFLSELVLQGNQLVEVGRGFGRFVALTSLDLTRNNLAVLPDCFSRLVNIVYLILDHNRLIEFPEQIQNRLRHLQQLEMSFNRLEALPRLRKQKNLRVFNFAGNKAAALEASTLTNLRSLKYFSAEQNQLATVDPVLYSITSLVYLNVADNNLSSDDVTGLSNLVNLTNLMVAYNRRLGAIPGLDSLTQLEELIWGGCDLDANEIPDDVYRLVSLKRLFMSCAGIRAVSQRVSRLAALEELYLDGNEISRLPEAITRLTDLKDINVANNRLDFVPAKLLLSPALEYIDVSGNRIRSFGRADDDTASIIVKAVALKHLKLAYNPLSVAEKRAFFRAVGDRIWMWFDGGVDKEPVVPGSVDDVRNFSWAEMLGRRVDQQDTMTLDGTLFVPQIESVPRNPLLEQDHPGAVPRDTSAQMPFQLFCVFDGHGGDHSSVFAAKAFPRLLARKLALLDYPLTLLESNVTVDTAYSSSGMDEVMGAICLVFDEVQESLIELEVADGTTAVVVLAYERWLYVAHCGDSRAILCREADPTILSFSYDESSLCSDLWSESAGGSSDGEGARSASVRDRSRDRSTANADVVAGGVGGSRGYRKGRRAVSSPPGVAAVRSDPVYMVEALTSDHKPTLATEHERIKAEVGSFVSLSGRVDGVLAVARSLGDINLQPAVTYKPVVTRRYLSAADQRVVIACDGLWDVLDSEEVGRIAMDGPLETAAIRLREKAFMARSADNISVVVVDVAHNVAGASAHLGGGGTSGARSYGPGAGSSASSSPS